MALLVMDTTTNKIENYTTPGDVTRLNSRSTTTCWGGSSNGAPYLSTSQGAGAARVCGAQVDGPA